MTLYQIEEPKENLLVAVGIDLGTTNSLIAISQDSKVKIIEDELSKKLLPSTISFKNGKILIGKEGEINISSIKRLMGKTFGDLTHDQIVSYNCTSNDGNSILIKIGDEYYNPVELSSLILKHLKERAQKYLKKTVTHAVITVPAYFDDKARNDTKLAAYMAELEVLRLINEPTAASLAYNLDNSKNGTYLIYDLGGGTFDVSLLKMQEGIFQVLATKGDTMLGGDDFDEAIAKYLLVKNPRHIKEKLTNQNEIMYENKKITRNDLNKIIEPFIKRTISMIRDVIKEAQIEETQIDSIVLVGGSTRIPYIKELLLEHFKIRVLDDVNPDEVVALGAALQAENLTSGLNNLLLDVVPLSLGIELMGGVVEKIIPRNSPIPISFTTYFTTHVDFQNAIKFHIVQGERELARDCRSLAFFELKNLPAKKAGFVKISVTFTIDVNGLLKIYTTEKETKQSKLIEILPSPDLNKGYIEETILDAKINLKKDIKNKILIESITAAENLIKTINELVTYKNKFTEKDKKEITSKIKLLSESISLKNVNKINKGKKQLEELVNGLLI